LFAFLFTAPLPSTLSTLSLHDALPIYFRLLQIGVGGQGTERVEERAAVHVLSAHTRDQALFVQSQALVYEDRNHPVAVADMRSLDRKSTRLNSSHVSISYAVFCLKKKK